MTSLTDEKKRLRSETLREIEALPEVYVASSDAGILANLTALPEFIAASVILFYCSVGREPDTRKAIELAARQNKTVALPAPYRGGKMLAREFVGFDALEDGLYGIPAPPDSARTVEKDDVELIIVPAVSFTADGRRLGYGGGYYDRYLPDSRAFTVGLARQRLVKSYLPSEPHDVPVRCLVTETGASYL
jgi:5-formyltetrahydrofolate cyclo-ligase